MAHQRQPAHLLRAAVACCLLPAAALADPPATSVPLGGPVPIISEAWPFGCRDRTVVDRLNTIMVTQGDGAFLKALQAMPPAQCRAFATGDLVYVLDAPFAVMAARVRFPGERESWYINAHLLMTAEQQRRYVALVKEEAARVSRSLGTPEEDRTQPWFIAQCQRTPDLEMCRVR